MTFWFDSDAVTSILILGCGCDDQLHVNGSVTVPSTIDGGEGNDLIIAGSGDDLINGGAGDDRIYAGDGNDVVDGGVGNDLIVAGNGNDRLVGGAGRDFMIGGSGADTLHGRSGDDVLIAGYTRYDTSDTALRSLLAEWTSGKSYAARVYNLRTGGGLTHGYRLNGNNGTCQTVFSDNDVDRLKGNRGMDLFWANLVADDGGVLDIVEKSDDEAAFDTDF